MSELVGGKGNRQRLWEAMRARRGQTWTRYDICRAANVDDRTAESYFQGLLAAEIIVIAEVIADVPVAGRSSRHRGAIKGVRQYKLVKDTGAEAPRVNRKGKAVTQGLAQEQMWRTLRLLKCDCNARELAAHASTGTVPVAHAAAADYLRTLAAAGYLECTREQRHNPNLRGGSQGMRYRLKITRDTGPRPPMICRTHAVFDANENRIVWQPEITDEDAIYG